MRLIAVFDSSAKAESGVVDGARKFLGFYSECIEALPRDAAGVDRTENSTVYPDFTSVYCLSTLRLTPPLKTIDEVFRF